MCCNRYSVDDLSSIVNPTFRVPCVGRQHAQVDNSNDTGAPLGLPDDVVENNPRNNLV